MCPRLDALITDPSCAVCLPAVAGKTLVVVECAVRLNVDSLTFLVPFRG